MTAASRGQQINTKYKQISKVVHMFLPEIETKSISISASAQISILLNSESEWAQKRCTGSAPMALQLSDKTCLQLARATKHARMCTEYDWLKY